MFWGAQKVLSDHCSDNHALLFYTCSKYLITSKNVSLTGIFCLLVCFRNEWF